MILVAGATGMLGGAITTTLLDEGRDVRVLVRPGSDYTFLTDAGAEAASGDLKEPLSLVQACEGVRTVITTANSAARGGADTVDSVDLVGNRNLIDAAAASGVERFIFVSALGAAEDSPVPFLRAKAHTERHLRESGMTYTILQPNLFMEVWIGMIVGAPVSAKRPVTLVGEGTRRHSMISMRDVARFAVACIDHPGARDQTIALGGPRAVSWRDVVAVTERVVGRSIEVRTVPPGTALPGLPETASQLAAALDGYDSELPMEETARGFGVELTSVDDWARGVFGKGPGSGA